jgi:pimeloyl-ACP methyl ester carboxylesterase
VPAVERSLAEPDGTAHHTVATDDGGSLHVVERGDRTARPLVLLHGVTLSSRVWAHQVAELSTRFRVIAPDWRGHGRSLAGSEGYGLGRLARDLGMVLDALDVRDAVLVGHSMGGMAVMRFAADDPDGLHRHAAGVVFMSSAAADTASGPVSQLFRAANVLLRRGPGLVDRLPVTAPGNLGYTITRLGFGRQPAAVWVDETRSILAEMSSPAAGRSVVALLDHDCRDSLAALDLPALVVVGSHDLLTPPRQSREIAALVPGAELIVLPDAGHMLMLERREALERALLDFADRLPARTTAC